MEDILISSVAGASIIPPVEKMTGSKTTTGETPDKESKVSSSTKKEEKPEKEISIPDLVKQINEFVKTFSTKISFRVDQESGQSIILVTERETGKVIRQIPPEEVLSLQKKMDEIAGIIFNRRV